MSLASLTTVRSVLCSLALLTSAGVSFGQANEPPKDPDFQDVLKLVRDNLKGATETELNHAAVSGFIGALYPKVALVTNAVDQAGVEDANSIGKTATFEGTLGYIRVSSVRAGLAKQLSDALRELGAKQKLGGLILDLRFAGGQDYAAAAAVADLFVDNERPLLKWGDVEARSTEKNDAIPMPIAVLINRGTAGAAEALAAVLKETDVSLAIGNQTAGEARVYKEFPLGNGQRIRVTSEMLEIGEGRRFPEEGLAPDLLVAVDEKAERTYLDDPYAAIDSGSGAGGGGSDPASTNGMVRRRFNESELIRMRGAGKELNSGASAEPKTSVQKPLIRDPALARAVDFLKGLALFRKQP